MPQQPPNVPTSHPDGFGASGTLLPSAAAFLTEASARSAPDIVFHYTSYSALRGILESRVVWATNVRHLNDSSEYSYALGLLRGAIVRAAQTATNERDRDFPWRVFDQMGVVLGHGSEQLVANLGQHASDILGLGRYVTSFTENGNQLSQWRAYCPKAGGVSIGFRTAEIRGVLEKQPHIDNKTPSPPPWTFAKCEYDPARQAAIMDGLVADLLSELHRKFPSPILLPDGIPTPPAALEAMASPELSASLALSLDAIAPVLKDPAFHEENEWRLISPRLVGRVEGAKFRDGPGRLIPYLEFKPPVRQNGTAAVRWIRVGPTDNPLLATTTLLALVNDMDDIAIDSSGIPYRE